MLNENPEINNDYKIKSKSGEDRWIRLSTKAIFKDGKLVGGTGTLVDVTPTKLIELELQKSEESFRHMVENINDVVYEIGIDGTVKYVSPSIERFLGRSA